MSYLAVGTGIVSLNAFVIKGMPTVAETTSGLESWNRQEVVRVTSVLGFAEVSSAFEVT